MKVMLSKHERTSIPQDLDELPGIGISSEQSLVPSVSRELDLAVREQIANVEPKSVLGILLKRREPMTVELLSLLTGLTGPEVRWTVQELVAAGLAVFDQIDGVEHVALFVPISDSRLDSAHLPAPYADV